MRDMRRLAIPPSDMEEVNHANVMCSRRERRRVLNGGGGGDDMVGECVLCRRVKERWKW